MWTDDATAASSGADQPDPAPTVAPAIAPAIEPAPATPAPAEMPLDPRVSDSIATAWEQQAQIVEALIDRKISEAIAGMGSQLAAIRALIVSPAEIDAFVDRKIAAMPAPAAAAPAAPTPAQPGAVQPGATHASTAGNVGATGAHGDLGANKA